MKRGVPSAVANVALAVGVVFAVTFAVGYTLRYQSLITRPATRGNAAKIGAIYLRLPAAPRRVAVPSPPALPATPTAEPFDPPPPPMETASPSAAPAVTSAAAAAPAIHDAPPPRAKPPRQDIRLHFDEAEAGATVPATDRPPGGRSLSGHAVVTAALELNVAGKPLKLAGVKLPVSTDLCAPNAGYAARSCADVTRQALAAWVAAKGDVSCQILGAGRAAWPAVCQDRAGEDLAAYLIEQGFALADDNDMIDYSAVETRARAARSGLWSYR